MHKVDFNLEEQFSDLRSNEVAYKFTVQNKGAAPIELLSLNPRIPEEVKLLEIVNPSVVALKAKYESLCKELSSILNDHLLISFKEVQSERIKAEIKVLQEVIGSGAIAPVLRPFFNIFSGRYRKILEENNKLWGAYRTQIENHSQAKAAYGRWMNGGTGGKNAITNIFEEKLQRLEELENAMQGDRNSSSLATIEPESFFAVTYVLKFNRQRWEPKKYNLAIEGVYRETGKEQRHIGGATTSLIISPAPIPLTILAIISSALGVLLKQSIELSTKNVAIPPSMEAISKSLYGPQMALFLLQVISGFILALVFFNVYEHTEIGKKIGLGVSWRSALLIGVLCGLLSDRVLAAVKALIGA